MGDVPMLIELFIFFQLVVIVIFIASFFTKQELLWGISFVLSGVLMFMSYNIEYYVYQYNATISAYSAVIVSHTYPYLTGINLLFFGLSLVLGLFDIFDKYGSKLITKKTP
jgi:hypothetical protein